MKPKKRKVQSDIFVWSAMYRLGIVVLDRQHKKLVDLINTLARKLAEQADDSALLKVFDELASYANYHFRTEENLMREHDIDAAYVSAHCNSHAAFTREVEAARNAAQENPLEVSTRMLTFLSRWLIQHILGSDMRMANEIIALEKGMTPSEARSHAQSKLSDTHEVLLKAMGELYECLALRTQDFLLANRRLKEEIVLHKKAEEELNLSQACMQAALEETREQPSHLAVLADATELMLTCRTEDECYRALAQAAERLSLGTGGALAVVAADGENFRTVAEWGSGSSMCEIFASDSCWALRRAKPHEIVDPAKGLGCSHFSGPMEKPYLCLPLVVQGQAVGVLHLVAGAAADQAGRARLTQLGMALGNTLKLALSNIRLSDALRAQKGKR